MHKLYVVGLGPGGADGMTVRAKAAIEASDVVVGYTVYIDLIRAQFPEKEYLSTPMRKEVDRVRLALETAAQGKTVAMVCSGDAGVYGMSGLCEELLPAYPGVTLETVPGVSAVLSGAAILGAPLMHDFAVISLSDLLTPWETIEKRLLMAADPDGEWSEPIVIDFAIGSCDPTLYFEDDKCYFLWKEGDIKICEIDVETGKQLGDIHHLGTGLGGRYPEGPHIYKKDGYYYLLLAEGGTEQGHHVNILRSKNLFGPYEPNRANPILSHFNMEMQGSEIQGLGHADLVQAPDSTWWMIWPPPRHPSELPAA